MIGRRELLGATAASVAMASVLKSQVAQAASPAQAAEAMQALAAVTPPASAMKSRGMEGRLVRLPSLDLESLHDFTYGFRRMHNKLLREASAHAFDRLLEREGIDPTEMMDMAQLRTLLDKDPAILVANKTWLANQLMMWHFLRDHFHENADYYLSEMEAADKKGPGKLELAPQMNIPDYARHEIHIQPGGYVGDPFAGHIYHYGTNSFYVGTQMSSNNHQDEIHRQTANRLPLPKDGKVRRILDYGCGIGQFTVALKERFPDAEVWGVDVGGPMVRYGHMRANRLGIGANFAQRLAQDTGFPDGYFDLVVSYIAHHEMPAQVTRDVIKEMYRVTRKGGVYYPVDFSQREGSGDGRVRGAPRGLYAMWLDHRWNNEVWSLEYHSLNFTNEIAKGGFEIQKNAVAALPGFGIRHAVKPA
jgi:ubiquinone/menaquinone biosynthesis C-methylase UbiE